MLRYNVESETRGWRLPLYAMYLSSRLVESKLIPSVLLLLIERVRSTNRKTACTCVILKCEQSISFLLKFETISCSRAVIMSRFLVRRCRLVK